MPDDAADAAEVTLPEPTVVVPLAAVAVTVPEALPEPEMAAVRVDQPCHSTQCKKIGQLLTCAEAVTTADDL